MIKLPSLISWFASHNISVVYQGIVTKTFLLIFLGLLLIGETLFQLLKFYVLYSPNRREEETKKVCPGFLNECMHVHLSKCLLILIFQCFSHS